MPLGVAHATITRRIRSCESTQKRALKSPRGIIAPHRLLDLRASRRGQLAEDELRVDARPEDRAVRDAPVERHVCWRRTRDRRAQGRATSSSVWFVAAFAESLRVSSFVHGGTSGDCSDASMFAFVYVNGPITITSPGNRLPGLSL